ncbi:MAG: preprotein translocase subunit YajC [Actinomycetota bacterium]
MSPLVFFAGALVFFWVLVVLPQRRRRQKQMQMLRELEPGDEVITAGGLYGSVREVAGNHVVLEIAPETRVRVAKSAVGARVEPELGPATPPETSLP